jgi:hypothetical protein
VLPASVVVVVDVVSGYMLLEVGRRGSVTKVQSPNAVAYA